MTQPPTPRRILNGIRVVDITQLVAGPYCARMLADLGAHVVRIERPHDVSTPGPRRATGAPSLNLGKRAISLDLKQPEGLAVATRLIERADVVLENYRPGVLSRLGLGYDAVSVSNPRIVYASISGFGQDNSFSHRRAYGATAQAEAGWIWVQQQAQGGPEPFAPGITIADMVTGMNAFSAILAALYDREHTGRGLRIDISLMDSQLAMLTEVASEPLRGKTEGEWQPFRHGLQKAVDGYLAVNIGGPHNWNRIAEAFGHRDVHVPADPRVANRLLSEWIGERTAAEAARLLEQAGAPYGVVKSMRQAVEHPYFAERGMLAELPDPIEGTARFVSSPLFFSDATSQPNSGAPLAGQHTQEVLAELGYDESEIASLFTTGAAQHQNPPDPAFSGG